MENLTCSRRHHGEQTEPQGKEAPSSSIPPYSSPCGDVSFKEERMILSIYEYMWSSPVLGPSRWNESDCSPQWDAAKLRTCISSREFQELQNSNRDRALQHGGPQNTLPQSLRTWTLLPQVTSEQRGQTSLFPNILKSLQDSLSGPGVTSKQELRQIHRSKPAPSP